jgi:hypothetical protein
VDYEEAEKLAYTKKWKVSTCSSGEGCWCRIVEPEEKIEYTIMHSDDDSRTDEFYFIGSGSVDKDLAEYIVKLHNENIIKKEK